MNQRKYKPDIYMNIPSLQENRTKYLGHLKDKGVPKRDLDKNLEDMEVYTQFYKAHPLPKKPKEEKFGTAGMNDLARIVLDMNKDIKQIKDAQSYSGAQAWVLKNGVDRYGAVYTDVNGDEIKDVVVQRKDANGQLIDGNYVIVNGYTTAESTYPYRQAYYEAYPTRDARKQAREEGMTYKNFITAMYNPQYDDDRMKIQSMASQDGENYERKLKAAGYTKVIKPHDRTPYQVFSAFVIKPIYDVLKKLFNNKMSGKMFTKLTAMIWNQAILAPAMGHVYGEKVFNVSDDEWKKLRNKKQVKEAIKQIVIPYVHKDQYLLDFVPVAIDICNNNGYGIPEGGADLIVQYLKARVLDAAIPQDNDWSQINAAYDERIRQQNGINEQ